MFIGGGDILVTVILTKSSSVSPLSSVTVNLNSITESFSTSGAINEAFSDALSVIVTLVPEKIVHLYFKLVPSSLLPLPSNNTVVFSLTLLSDPALAIGF